ncbi:MAG: tetratricopeptide repeat protein, partial [Elusimicrobia bacterium]|nr:tetratricopeptide repeat protein [Elusimicrobiota bacterium]
MNDKTINQETAKDLLKEGRSLVDSGDFHKALAVLEKTLKNSPNLAEIYYETGKALFFLNKYGEASKNYKKALELDPSYPMPYLGLGTVFIRQKKILEAEKALKTFLSLDVADDQKVEALWNLGRFYRLYAEKKNSRKLKDILEKLSEYPEIVFSNPRIASEAAKIARLTGESKRSEEIIKRLIQTPLIKQDKFTYNCLLNELEITQKKEIIESKPRSMVAMILDKCNLKCLMCNVWQSQWQAKDKTLREIADWFPYLEDISWEGGEVFMMDGFEDLLAEGGRYKNLSQIIFTNGLM